MARLWDEFGTWTLVIAGLTSVYAVAMGAWGIFFAFNMALTLATGAVWLMDCFRPARLWLPRLSRWIARSFAAFLPIAGFIYFVVSDYSRPQTETARIALCAGTLAALICLYINVQADVFTRRCRP